MIFTSPSQEGRKEDEHEAHRYMAATTLVMCLFSGRLCTVAPLGPSRGPSSPFVLQEAISRAGVCAPDRGRRDQNKETGTTPARARAPRACERRCSAADVLVLIRVVTVLYGGESNCVGRGPGPGVAFDVRNENRHTKCFVKHPRYARTPAPRVRAQNA